MDDPPLAPGSDRQLMCELRIPLTVVMGRMQLLRRRLKQGAPPEVLAADLETIAAALIRLTAAVERLDSAR